MDKQMVKYYRDIMADIPLIDSHAHFPPERAFQTLPKDFMEIIDYSYTDLVSAGLDTRKFNSPFKGLPEMYLSNGCDPLYQEPSMEEKWEMIKKYWPYVRTMGPGINARKTLQMYFGVEDFTDDTIPVINAKLKELQKKSYKEILAGVNVEKVVNISINGSFGNPPTDELAQLIYTDILTEPNNRDYVRYLESVTKRDIYSLDTYVDALDQYLEMEIRQNGFKGFKLHTTSFIRALEFSEIDKNKADKQFDQLLTTTVSGSLLSGKGRSYDELYELHNYLQNHLIQKSIELGVTIQVHTGTFGGSNGAKIKNSDPALLTTVLMRYPQARFDFLHSGFPYTRELGEMVREFPNLYLNVTWHQLLSPRDFIQYMRELALWVPTNKIMGYGSDEFNVLNGTATAEIYRDYMARVLAGLVYDGDMTEKEAVFFANRVSRENAKEFFRL